jgi:hypothetical protein
MKKAKIMLSALAVLAVLGTAVAFKAHTYRNFVLFTGTGATDCTNQVQGIATTTTGTQVYASTTSTTAGCVQLYTIAVND